MSDSCKTYDEIVFDGLSETSEENKATLRELKKAALNRAHDIRKFEIELYWRRNLYFWGFNVALFAAVGIILSDSPARANNVGILPTALVMSLFVLLGVFVTFAWYHVHLGAKTWQRNWEKHIDFLEDGLTGRLHKTTLGNRTEFYSVSRINGDVIIAIGVMWVLLGLLMMAPKLKAYIQSKSLEFSVLIVVISPILWCVFRCIEWPTSDSAFGRKCEEDGKHYIYMCVVRPTPTLKMERHNGSCACNIWCGLGKEIAP